MSQFSPQTALIWSHYRAVPIGNLGTGRGPTVFPLGLTGTAGHVQQNTGNSGNTGPPHLVCMNPVSTQPSFGATANGTDSGGTATVGGGDNTSTSDRTGISAGDGTSQSCMTSGEQNVSTGTGTPPGPGTQGSGGDTPGSGGNSGGGGGGPC